MSSKPLWQKFIFWIHHGLDSAEARVCLGSLSDPSSEWVPQSTASKGTRWVKLSWTSRSESMAVHGASPRKTGLWLWTGFGHAACITLIRIPFLYSVNLEIYPTWQASLSLKSWLMKNRTLSVLGSLLNTSVSIAEPFLFSKPADSVTYPCGVHLHLSLAKSLVHMYPSAFQLKTWFENFGFLIGWRISYLSTTDLRVKYSKLGAKPSWFLSDSSSHIHGIFAILRNIYSM